MTLGDVEEGTGDINRCEHREQNTEDQSHSESTNLVSTDRVKHECSDQRGQVSVDNRDCRLGESIANCHSPSCPFLELFANAFENQHVRVNGHTDGQNKTCQAWQSQWLIDQHHGAKNHSKIHHKGHTGNETCEPVINEDEYQNQSKGCQNRVDPLVDGIFPQCCINLVFSDRLLRQSGR